MTISNYNITMLNIQNFKLPISFQNENDIKMALSKKLKCNIKDITHLEIKRRSLDARSFPILYNYSINFEIKNEKNYIKKKGISITQDIKLKLKKIETDKRPIIVGYGPSGIFLAIGLIRQGIKPIIFERGKEIDERIKDVDLFFTKNILNEESNIQFGAGGAGTFSDAKLTTRSKDKDIDYILDVLVEFGAKKEIKYDHLPHIGTDEIRKIIKRITSYLKENGATFYFDTKVEDFIIENSTIKAVVANKKTYYSDYVALSCGHSAFDTIKKLNEKGVSLEIKEFAIGVRVEHPAILINKNQHHKEYEKLEAASYKLIHKINTHYSAYSFCMCPGGYIVSSGSNKNSICLNGMSYANRSNKLSNSGILIPVRKDDFYKNDVLDGIKYILNYEEKAFNLSNSYKAPAQNILDFMNNELNPLIFKSSYQNDTFLYNLNNFFEPKIITYLKEAFLNFESKIPGFIKQGIMLAPETRSSCPIRIVRNKERESINIENLFPVGEGAGYAGGIISSCLDGLKTSIQIANKINTHFLHIEDSK